MGSEKRITVSNEAHKTINGVKEDLELSTHREALDALLNHASRMVREMKRNYIAAIIMLIIIFGLGIITGRLM